MATRIIHKAAGTAGSEVADLLQSIFVSELLSPSRQFWIVSPWISDVGVIDNRDGRFSIAALAFGSRMIHLSEVLAALLSANTRLRIVARSAPENEQLLAGLERREEDSGPREAVVTRAEELHTKGILGDDFFLSGSMNLTRNGIAINDELLHFSRDPDAVASAQVAFSQRWGRPSGG